MQVRKLRKYVPLTREQFRARFYERFYDPTSHDQLDASPDIFTEVENAARSLAQRVRDIRSGQYRAADAGLRHPRQK